MQIGIGLPGMIPGTTGEQIVEWARRADAGPFSSLASLDRLVYRNYESLITLAAAAAVTQRVRLMTTVLIAPLHNPAIFAKQAASIDALSHGRLTLGLGVGARDDDYRAAGVDFHTRGWQSNAQLKSMKQVWSGERLSADTGPIVPTPVRPAAPVAHRRLFAPGHPPYGTLGRRLHRGRRRGSWCKFRNCFPGSRKRGRPPNGRASRASSPPSIARWNAGAGGATCRSVYSRLLRLSGKSAR